MLSISHLLNRSLALYRYTEAPDGAGGRTRTLGQVGDLVCRLSQPTAVEVQYGASASAEVSQVVYFDAGTDIRRGDVLRDAGTTAVYRVISVVEPSVSIYRKAMCEHYQVEDSQVVWS